MTLWPSKVSAAVVFGVSGVLVMAAMLGGRYVSGRHAFLMIRDRSALAKERQHRVDAAMLGVDGVDPELAEDPADVLLDGRDGDHQGFADAPVRLPLGHRRQDLELPRAELRDAAPL